METDFHLSSAIKERETSNTPRLKTQTNHRPHSDSCIKINNHSSDFSRSRWNNMIAFILQSRRPGTYCWTEYCIRAALTRADGHDPAERWSDHTCYANGDSSGNTGSDLQKITSTKTSFWWTTSYTYSCANKFKAWLSDIYFNTWEYVSRQMTHTSINTSSATVKRMLPWLAITPIKKKKRR